MNVRALGEAGLVDAWRSGPAVAVSVGLIALGLMFHTEVVAAVTVWEQSTAYNHCFLVIPIVLYLIWDRRDTLHGVSADPYPLAALLGVTLVVAAEIALAVVVRIVADGTHSPSILATSHRPANANSSPPSIV